MAAKMTIEFIKDPVYLPGETFRIEVNGTVQGDIISPWGSDRAQRGFGYWSMATGRFGIGPSVPFGEGLFGEGLFGQGVRKFAATTVQSFVAGDHSVRVKARDAAGNDGAWSSTFTVEHRPVPPTPTSLTLSANTLGWSWQDP